MAHSMTIKQLKTRGQQLGLTAQQMRGKRKAALAELVSSCASQIEPTEALLRAKAAEAAPGTICPSCGAEIAGTYCRLCGCRQCINSVSQQAIWMRNGRIVAGFANAKQAYIAMAAKFGIPRERWPRIFLEE